MRNTSPQRVGGRRTVEIRETPMILRRPSRTKIHWFAVGQVTSAQRPLGDQASWRNAPVTLNSFRPVRRKKTSLEPLVPAGGMRTTATRSVPGWRAASMSRSRRRDSPRQRPGRAGRTRAGMRREHQEQAPVVDHAAPGSPRCWSAVAPSCRYRGSRRRPYGRGGIGEHAARPGPQGRGNERGRCWARPPVLSPATRGRGPGRRRRSRVGACSAQAGKRGLGRASVQCTFPFGWSAASWFARVAAMNSPCGEKTASR